ncbi:BREX-1 system adenine-specific DNA-methyltransferase PglX [Microbacterium sp. KHB019]|uniref:BREX-1 system adenine-specific DNA-methyltransferase PglX n=1 Tax=Microbacterium sp. KHB019 TaxID=3129770 RepID=UPI00307974C4
METPPLKSFATRARSDLIKEVGARVTVVLAENSLARVESAPAVRALEDVIARDGRDQVIDRVAYTWFNRIIALRFMDANGYTPSGVVSPEVGRTTGQPEVLAEAKAGTIDGAVVPQKTQDTITALLNGTRPSQDPQGEAYGLLLEAYCRSWHRAMPFMFEREGDYTELLIPTALLAADSVRDRAVKTLTEDVCREVEVIGWLYQFYISDRKGEVFDGFKKNKKAGAAEIPAATQLFTPHWIVRYLVENSLGRLWLLNNPTSRLAEQMDYYIEPVDEEPGFLRITKPEELKIIDPAVGSGHMLTYAFDLLYAMYMEKGYDPAEIPSLILQHNLYGTEIDPRAGALAAFALTMKAAAKRKLFLKNPVQANVRVLENVHLDPHELDYLWSLTSEDDIARGDADEFWNAFEYADTFGSLIQPKRQLIAPLRAAIEGTQADGDLLHGKALEKAYVVIEQAAYLARRYLVVVANPPYMGSGNMSSPLQTFVNSNYAEGKSDLFAAFILRITRLGVPGAYAGVVTMQSWMFIASFEKLRARLLAQTHVATMAHLGTNGFDSIGGDVVATTAFVLELRKASGSPGVYVRLVSGENEAAKAAMLRAGAARYLATGADFTALPGMPIAYWLPESVKDVFGHGTLLRDVANPRVGMATGDNGRWIRQWWEVSEQRIGRGLSRTEASRSGRRWFPYATSGSATRWFGNVSSVVNWEHDGHLLQTTKHESGRIRAHNFNLDQIFKAGLVWNVVTSGTSSFRYVDDGYLFDASAGLCHTSRPLYLLGLLNSTSATYILNAINPTFNLPPGSLGALPLPVDSAPQTAESLASEALRLARRRWNRSETSWEFAAPLRMTGARLADLVQAESDARARATRELFAIECQLDQHFATAYETQDAVQARVAEADIESGVAGLVVEFASYAVGCMFGRFSLEEPGLILANQGSTLEDYLALVPSPSFMPDKDNVIPIVDGDWFEDDIVARFRQFLRAAFGEDHFEENLQFVTESLGVKDIRDYFVKSFYSDHVKRYKKRPIYWLFRSPKGSFSALIYLHRYTPSTASTVLTGYLREFIGKLEANLEHQGRVAAGMGGASPREVAAALKEADRIRKVLVELRDYEHDVLFPLAGQQIALDLDDGVLVNYQKLGSALKDIGLKKGGGGE